MGALRHCFSLCFLSASSPPLSLPHFSLSPFLPWFWWDPGWILLFLFSVAGLFMSIAGADFFNSLLRLVDGVMDPLQTFDKRTMLGRLLKIFIVKQMENWLIYLAPKLCPFSSGSTQFFHVRVTWELR